MHEVGRAAPAEHARGAGRAGSVEADGDDISHANIGVGSRQRQSVGDLREADVGTLDAAGGMLAESVDQEFPPLVQERVVDGGAA